MLRVDKDNAAGPVTTHSNQALSRLLAEVDPEVTISDQIGNGISVVSRTLVWANIATGVDVGR